MLERLRNSGDEWVQAVRNKDLRKLHELVNLWATMNCTPTEFVRADSIGKKTVSCSVKNIADAELLKKLDKVGVPESICIYFRSIAIVGQGSLAMADGYQGGP